MKLLVFSFVVMNAPFRQRRPLSLVTVSSFHGEPHANSVVKSGIEGFWVGPDGNKRNTHSRSGRKDWVNQQRTAPRISSVFDTAHYSIYECARANQGVYPTESLLGPESAAAFASSSTQINPKQRQVIHHVPTFSSVPVQTNSPSAPTGKWFLQVAQNVAP